MLWVVLAICVALLLWLAERTLITPMVHLTGEDVLATPGRPVTLVARLERNLFLFIDPPIRGAKVDFLLDGNLLGTALTDAGGFARYDAGPAVQSGRYTISALDATAPLFVNVVPRGSPVLVCDLDSTTADVSMYAFIFKSNERVRALGGAEKVIPDLMRSMTVVFLTARDHIFLEKTRNWLRRVGLPEGPVFIRRRRFWHLSPLQHKIEKLTELASEHKLVAGVGDTPSDIEAYLKHGMKAYLMCPKGKPPVSEGCFRVKDWSELEKDLAATSSSKPASSGAAT